MHTHKILWADDEIDLLKPHILFLKNKGYDVTPVNSGADALEKVEEESFDLIFLDENMPGISGLEVLSEIKLKKPGLPVVMITKSEEESIMEEAIGSQISDYLIKPINPNQVLLSVKKILDGKRIVTEKTTHQYQRQFGQISLSLSDARSAQDWTEIYQKLVHWDLAINDTENKDMLEILDNQKQEANLSFVKFIRDEYESWLQQPDADTPLLSHRLMPEKVFPLLRQSEEPVFFILIDNLRYDQWKTIEPLISEYFSIKEETYFSILPTTTAYARNAIFSGLMPSEIAKKYPQFWVGDDEDEGKNLHEHELLVENLKRNGLNFKNSYHKMVHVSQSKTLYDNLHELYDNRLNVLVYNFVDMLSHARTDTEMIKELAPDESAYRSLTQSWFKHSPLHDTLRDLAEKKARVIITTDHGTIRTKRPYKIVGDRNTNTNLRYKQGKNLNYDPKNVIVALKPETFHLPKANVSSTYVFATEDHFFAYPNNYNHYVKYYKDTFQHGGVSMEEVIIPFITLDQK